MSFPVIAKAACGNCTHRMSNRAWYSILLAASAVLAFSSCTTGGRGAAPEDRGKIGKADLPGSCVAEDGALACGGQSSGSCWCDDQCDQFGDCCADAPGACGVGFKGECTVTDQGVMLGCPDLQPCVLDNCDPGCEPLSGNCCEGFCAASLPDPIVVECTVTDQGETVGCGDQEICVLDDCDPGCALVSPECCDARCEPFSDLDPGFAECSITDDGVTVGCDPGEICLFGDCDPDCDVVSVECCEPSCEPFVDHDPTNVECVLDGGASFGCGPGEVCVEDGTCLEGCSDPAECCFDACLPA